MCPWVMLNSVKWWSANVKVDQGIIADYVSYILENRRKNCLIFSSGGVVQTKTIGPACLLISTGCLGSVGSTCANISTKQLRQPMIFSFGCCVLCYVSWLVWLCTSAICGRPFLFLFSFRLGTRLGNYISLFPTRPSTLTTHRYCTTLAAAH